MASPASKSASLDCFTTSELLNELLIRAQSAEGSFAANVKSLNSGSLVSNPDLETNHRLPGFEYSEHMFLGDNIEIFQSTGTKVKASEFPLTLQNQLQLTYGQISGLAGDFYGTNKPISDGTDIEDRIERFMKAFNILANNTDRTPDEVRNILQILQQEVEEVEKAVKAGQDPWDVVWPKLPGVNIALQQATIFRPSGEPSYLGLASINYDHFGEDATKSYTAGHQAAINIALSKKTEDNLVLAYAINAFADHYLQDRFAGGHLRTPRRFFHGTLEDLAPGYCAKYMHDEDCAIGLYVRNAFSDVEYTAFGDKRLFSEKNSINLDNCLKAVEISALEIFNAWSTGIAPEFQALNYAPTLASALDESKQQLKPLFVVRNGKLERRIQIENRRDTNTTDDFWFWKTALDCYRSGKWVYPEPMM